VGHFYVDRRHGFSQGFDEFLEHYDALSHSLVGSRKITDLALQFLGERGPEPFFLFVHYFDPHYEFMDQPDWSWADDYSGWLLEEERDIYNLRSKRHLLESDDIDYLRSLYDEEIASTDQQIGRLLSYLESEGLEDDTAIFVVADHGEEFLERGWLGHTISLHEEIVGVPMLAVLPGVDISQGVVSGPVETRALFGTVLDYLGVELPGRSPVSLLPTLRLDNDSSPTDAYSSVWLPPGRADVGKSVLLSSLRSGDWKLIVDHIRGKEFLYDLAEDPSEAKNLVADNPEKLAEMLVALEAWVAEMEAKGGSIPHLESNEELRDELRALGYL
jgi:arylsulfatase A-like enzyme